MSVSALLGVSDNPGLGIGVSPGLGLGPAQASRWPPPLSCCEQEEPTYFAIWGDNKAFNEVVISPAMLHEHLPYVVMEGLNKVRGSSLF